MQQSHPSFSVIVPTYERAGPLRNCLHALAGQNYPHDSFEVVVVDDGSSTSPKTSIEAFRNFLNIRLLTQLHSGPGAARNYGASLANNTFLAFTDDDCAPDAGWLQSLANGFALSPNCALGGRTVNGLPRNLYSTASQLIIDFLYAYFNADSEHARFLASNNLAFPAEQFRAIGGFNAGWNYAAGEDRELCDRWISYGHRILYAANATVYHIHPLTLRTFWRQHFHYGRGAFCFYQARSQRTQESIRLEPFSFYRNLLRHPFSQARGARALSLAALVVVSQLANTTGFLRERLNHTWIDERN